jgi:hypothetical protein
MNQDQYVDCEILHTYATSFKVRIIESNEVAYISKRAYLTTDTENVIKARENYLQFYEPNNQ